ncbi:MAG TPA: CBS domain-containing protein [Patescibacteria group bacterium]|nr:CBS domain-containing protein [Patescibacteria group bacterium]
MLVRDVMTAKVQSVTADTTVRQIAKILVDNGISGVPVVDSEGAPIGMVTESDLIALDANGTREVGRDWWLAHLAEGEPLSSQFLASLDQAERTARDVMTAPVVTIAESAELPEVARLFLSYRIKRLPVLREGKMVGIVSRADLVRRMAQQPAPPSAGAHRGGILSEMLAALEERFIQPDPVTPSAFASKAEQSRTAPVTAESLSALVDEFGHKMAERKEEEQQAAADARKALVKRMRDHHITDEEWQEILRRARTAAAAGQKELLLLRFPCDLCSDGGRAINAPLPNWPETLRGEAAEVYLHWERDLKPNGFHLTAKVLDFPGGIPGDIGLTLVWGGEATE